MKQTKDTHRMVLLAMFGCIELVLSMTGIGFIPLPLINATTMHIPVILGAVMLGPGGGAALGALFGLCSMWKSTMAPNILSFAFSPFLTTEGLPGVLKSIWIAFGCRVLFGLLAGLLWQLMQKVCKQDIIALSVTAAVSTVCHTLLVMGSIYILLAGQYAAAMNAAVSAVFGMVMTVVLTSGIPEAIAAAVLVTVVGKALLKIREAQQKR